MSARSFTSSFFGGEVTPEFWGQIGDAKFQAGLALCRNMVVLPHGPVRNRAGTAFVREVKDSSKRVRLLPFTYSTTQTMVLEFGAGYIRFHTAGATLLDGGGAPYEVATPYAESDLFDINFVQSADVLTLVHPGHAPRELRRLGPTSWALTLIAFVSALAVPAAPTVVATTASSPSGLIQHFYAVTSVGATGLEESAASAVSVAVNNNLLQTGAYNTISWVSTGAARYNVYKRSNGLLGYIGQTDGLTFKDDNITPNLGTTPPVGGDPFAGAGLYPGAVSYFEQRRCFAGSTNEPQNLRMTRSGTESNMSYSIPTRDDDAVNIRVAAREANTIRHIVPLSNLVLLTGAAEWGVTSVNSDAITPSSISVKPQSYIGANNVQPCIVNSNILYAAARGGHMREMSFQYQAGGYITGDLSLRAPHLFDGFEITGMAYSKAPHPLLWAISSSGKLLGLTYVPEQQIGAWHQHDTIGGAFESCAVVAEGAEDVLYLVVRRTIGGVTKRFVERMVPRAFTDPKDAYFVDCGATYRGAAATTVTGLDWLNGQTVSILGDGAVFAQQVVAGGSITIDQPCSVIHVGLPITADIQTLPVAAQVDAAFGQGRLKNVNRAWLRVYQSSGVFAGPSLDRLRQVKQRTNEPYGSAPRLVTDMVAIDVDPSWQSGGQIFIRQSDPLPLTIVALTVEVELGG